MQKFHVFVFQPGSKMVSSAKSSVPTVTDQAAAMQLGQCAKNLATSLAELRTAAQTVLNLSSPDLYLMSKMLCSVYLESRSWE